MDYIICRLCSSLENENYSILFIDIFEPENEIDICSLIMECTSLEAKENDCLPNTICVKCLDNLEKFSKFKKQCLKSVYELKTQFYQNNFDKFYQDDDRTCDDNFCDNQTNTATYSIELSDSYFDSTSNFNAEYEKSLVKNDKQFEETTISYIIKNRTDRCCDDDNGKERKKNNSLSGTCEYCGLFRRDLNDHVKMHVNYEKSLCFICGKKCRKFSGHLKLCKKRLLEGDSFERRRRKRERKEYSGKCHFCGLERRRLDKHIKIMHKDLVYLQQDQLESIKNEMIKDKQQQQNDDLTKADFVGNGVREEMFVENLNVFQDEQPVEEPN